MGTPPLPPPRCKGAERAPLGDCKSARRTSREAAAFTKQEPLMGVQADAPGARRQWKLSTLWFVSGEFTREA